MIDNKFPIYFLGAEPSSKSNIDIMNFFRKENNPYYDLLEHPPSLRPRFGWNLETLDIPKMRKGKYWEVMNGDRKGINLYRDGSMIAFGKANNDFLNWSKGKEPKINTLAIIEFTYEFVELYRKIAKNLIQQEYNIKSYNFRVGIKNSLLEEGKLFINPKEVHDSWYSDDEEAAIYNALDEDFEINETINKVNDEVVYYSRIVAYKIIKEILIHFQIPEDKIPYTKKDDDGHWFIDIDQFKKY